MIKRWATWPIFPPNTQVPSPNLESSKAGKVLPQMQQNATPVSPSRKHSLLLEARRSRSAWIRCECPNSLIDGKLTPTNLSTNATNATITSSQSSSSQSSSSPSSSSPPPSNLPLAGCTERVMSTSLVAQHMPNAENALKVMLFGGGGGGEDRER